MVISRVDHLVGKTIRRRSINRRCSQVPGTSRQSSPDIIPTSGQIGTLNHWGEVSLQKYKSLCIYAYLCALGRDLVSAQPYVGTTPAQPQQTWANGSAPTSSFSRVDSLAPENQPLSTSGLVGCEEVPQLLFTGGTPGALLNTYRPFRVENDLTGQYGTANASTSASSQPQGFMPEIFQDFQTEATYNQSLIGRLPEPNDLEPAPNWMNSMTSGDLVGRNMRSPQPDAGRYTLHSNQTFNFNENEWPMTFGLTVPGTDTTKAQMAPKIPGSPATAQTKKTMPDETANLVVTKTASKKKKGRRGFPNMAQKENTNRVKENGGACARCEKQKINVRINFVR